MLPLEMELKIGGVDVLHIEATRCHVALAANSLPASLGEVVASELVMDTR